MIFLIEKKPFVGSCMFVVFACLSYGQVVDTTSLFNYENQAIPSYIPANVVNTIPADNQITDEGATLGRVLFYDKRLSVNNSISCSSCHQQEFAFSDPDIASTGVNGTTGRHSMRLINAAFVEASDLRMFWDKRAADVEDQATQPIKDHVEMGFSGADGDPNFNDLISKLDGLPEYRTLFSLVYGDAMISEDRIQKAIAQFVRSIQSFDSKYDEGMALHSNNSNANFSNYTVDENEGKTLFRRAKNNGGAGCAACHKMDSFHLEPLNANNGVITAIGGGTDLTNTRSPSLRDLANTNGVPHTAFMHDGSLATLVDVVEHYNDIAPTAGLAARLGGPAAGQQLNLTTNQMNQIAAFLATLTGSDVYTDPKWSDPFGVSTGLTVIAEAEINVEDSSSDQLIHTVSDIDFGVNNLGVTSVVETLTIFNDGGSALNSLNAVITGPEASDFIVSAFSVSELAPGESTTITVHFYAADSGPRSGILEISSNDGDESPFSINLSGVGTAAEIGVSTASGTILLDDADQLNFGIVSTDTNQLITLVITNEGSTALTGLAAALDGANASSFEILNFTAGSLNGNDSMNFSVRFKPSRSGELHASLRIASSDVDENPFDIELRGEGINTSAQHNVILIIADDLGTDSLAVYNDHPSASLPPTPNIDFLKDTGIRFDRFYGYSMCSPTRAAILTGRYGYRTGVLSPAGAEIAPNEFTLPEALLSSGVISNRIQSVGKWHLGNNRNDPNLAGGWPNYIGARNNVGDYFDYVKTENGVESNSTDYLTTDEVNESIDWIQQQGTNSWFQWLAFHAPHGPTHKPPNNLHDYDALPEVISGDSRPYFEAMVQAMDTEIGRLLENIDLSVTTVIFIGDNGTPSGQIQPPMLTGKGKGTIYEGGIRIPLIVCGAAVNNDLMGTTNDVLLHATDLYSTILELFEVNSETVLPKTLHLDSYSFADALEDPGYIRGSSAIHSLDLEGTNYVQSLIEGDFKYIVDTTTLVEEFYNVANDISESTNLLSGTLSVDEQLSFDILKLEIEEYINIPRIYCSYPDGTGTNVVEFGWFKHGGFTLWSNTNAVEDLWLEVPEQVFEDDGTSTLRLKAPEESDVIYYHITTP